MNFKFSATGFFLFRLLLVLNPMVIFCQNVDYKVMPLPFCSKDKDEFSPVFYQNGLVFTSNLRDNSFIGYQSNQSDLFNIFFVEEKDSLNWGKVKLLANELTSNFNDGPATFNEAGNIIYYCRNNKIHRPLKDFNDTTNKMGIYSANLVNDKWINIEPFIFNDPRYSYITPSLSPDGNRLYFSSDRYDGYGGFDLYYCDKNENTWNTPVNMGSDINTAKDETFPFASVSGKLFFASDGHIGMGGKDLYFTEQVQGRWLKAIHLDSAINSPYDDFGIVTNEQFNKGYFSSNRKSTDDIFQFEAKPVEFPVCNRMQKNNYCFTFDDERLNSNDTIPVLYIWDFYGIKKTGLRVRHCFSGPGRYEVVLNIVDSVMNDSVLATSSYKFEIKDAEQVFINSPDSAMVGSSVTFDGLKTNLTHFKISDYWWDFGEGFNLGGALINKTFKEPGIYVIKLGLTGAQDDNDNKIKTCIYKTIHIFSP